MELEAQGAEVTLEQARAWFRALADELEGAPLAWSLVAETSERDLDSGTPLITWRDAALGPDPASPPRYTLRVGVANGEGNPRDGYGYHPSAELLGPDGAKVASARSSGWNRTFSPFLVELAGLEFARWEAARRVLGRVLPHLQDNSLGERAVTGMAARLKHAGRTEDARGMLAAWAATPLLQPSHPPAVARLCQEAASFGLLDRALAERWVGAAASAPAAWAFLARQGGGGGRSAEEAAGLVWRADPWPVERLREAWERESEAGREAIRQMCWLRSDPRLTWRPDGERPGDPWVAARASEARTGQPRLLVARRPGSVPDLAEALAARRGLPSGAVGSHTPGPPPDGPAGTFSGFRVAPGWAVRTTWVWPSPTGGAAFVTLLKASAADQGLHLGLFVEADGRWLRWTMSAGPSATGGLLGVPEALEWASDDPEVWEPDLVAALRIWQPHVP